MSYSEDLRQRVVDFVHQGGSKAEAARRFNVSRGRVYAWLSLPPDQLAARKPGPTGPRKLDLQKLETLLLQQPDLLQKEMAQQLGVCDSTVHYGRKRLKITRKKDPWLS